MNVLLIDCYNLGYAAFHAMGELGFHGRRTGVIYGILAQVLSLAKKFETNRFVFCWDSRKSLRKLLYPGYKNRPKNNTKELDTGEILDREAFYEQMTALYDTWLERLGFVNSFRYVGLEADDVIALVIKNGIVPKRWPKDIHWVITSNDRDMYQLLAANVSIYANKKIITRHTFEKKYGISPMKWVHAKAMGGCVSDTVEGIKGIADPAKSENSRAVQYLKGTLKGVFLDRIESEEGRQVYIRNLRLVSLPMVKHLEPVLKHEDFRLDDFVAVFDTLNFLSFLRADMIEKWIDRFEM